MLAALATLLFLAVLPVSAAAPNADETPKGPPPAAAQWLSRVNAREPGTFAPPRSFAASYGVSWGGVQAARVETRCTAPEGGDIQLFVKATTTGLARALYTLDATHLSVVNRRTLHPVRLEQSEETSGKRLTDHVDFSPGEAVRTNSNSQKKKDQAKSRPRHFPYPELYDMNSALLYTRSTPMTAGAEYTLPLMTATSPYLATIKVLGRNRVRVGAGEYPAIECSVALEKINRHGELEPRQGFKSAHAWMSDDADRLLLKVEAQVWVGAVSLELEKVNFTNPPTG